ncbi:hypothetical protein Acr_04g0003110 [Actinidia rufa]|uniref:Uncharacterized protein n=1 Tax=Actinidia rufa TaxID=165716 RepID=A0A7J0EGH6_9ERIC|nr:hypothetical protein Acr_04g0003110 [Actinidia rufa]
MQKQRESIRFTHFLSGLHSSFDSVHAQLLGSKELLYLSEVFSSFREASFSGAPSISAIGDRSALISYVGGTRSSSRDPNHFTGSSSFGRGGGSSDRAPGSGNGGGVGRALG